MFILYFSTQLISRCSLFNQNKGYTCGAGSSYNCAVQVSCFLCCGVYYCFAICLYFYVRYGLVIFFSINECEFPSGIFHLSFDGRNLLWCGIQNLLINYVSTNKDGMFYFCVLTLWPNFSVATSQTKPIFCRHEHT